MRIPSSVVLWHPDRKKDKWEFVKLIGRCSFKSYNLFFSVLHFVVISHRTALCLNSLFSRFFYSRTRIYLQKNIQISKNNLAFIRCWMSMKWLIFIFSIIRWVFCLGSYSQCLGICVYSKIVSCLILIIA